MIQVVDLQRPIAKRWRICRERKTRAGVATESIGLILHADSAEQAIKNARELFGKNGQLVAIPEES